VLKGFIASLWLRFIA